MAALKGDGTQEGEGNGSQEVEENKEKGEEVKKQRKSIRWDLAEACSHSIAAVPEAEEDSASSRGRSSCAHSKADTSSFGDRSTAAGECLNCLFLLAPHL